VNVRRWRPSSSWGGAMTPAVQGLLIANVVVFLFQLVSAQVTQVPLTRLFGLVPYEVVHHLFLWQLVTYMFLHGGIFHIGFNMLMLWMFGIRLEYEWGTEKFLRFYFITGIGAGVCTTLVSPNSFIATIGASGAIYGLLLAYGVLFPRDLLYIWGIFPIEARYLVLGLGVIAFWMSLTASGSGIAHVAHLGGMLIGWLYLRGPRWYRFRFGDLAARWKQERIRRKFKVYYRKTRGSDEGEEGDEEDGEER
jgi:membrane associated rhomboid family serine protease